MRGKLAKSLRWSVKNNINYIEPLSYKEAKKKAHKDKEFSSCIIRMWLDSKPGLRLRSDLVGSYYEQIKRIDK